MQKLIFAMFSLNLLVTQTLEDSSHMQQVFRDQFAKHEYVIQIHITKIRHTIECLMHEPLECAGGGVGQPKGHDLELKQTKFTSKCSPVLVFRGYAYLMVPTLQAKATKYTIPAQVV